MYTTVIHEARKILGISLPEFCYCDIVYNMGSNPQTKYKGWCHASHKYLGQILGVTKQTMINMTKSLKEKGLIETNSTGKLKRTTAKWYNAVNEFDLKLNTSFADIRCFYCETSILETNFELNYFNPLTKGGLNIKENLVIACEKCSLDKGELNGNDFLKQLGKEILPSDYGQPKNFTSSSKKGKKTIPPAGKKFLPNTNRDTNNYDTKRDTLFPDYEDGETTFGESLVSNKKVFFSKFEKEIEAGVDVDQYYHIVDDWCEGLSSRDKRKKKTAKGWIATVRGIMRRDKADGKLKMMTGVDRQGQITDEDLQKFMDEE